MICFFRVGVSFWFAFWEIKSFNSAISFLNFFFSLFKSMNSVSVLLFRKRSSFSLLGSIIFDFCKFDCWELSLFETEQVALKLSSISFYFWRLLIEQSAWLFKIFFFFKLFIKSNCFLDVFLFFLFEEDLVFKEFKLFSFVLELLDWLGVKTGFFDSKFLIHFYFTGFYPRILRS